MRNTPNPKLELDALIVGAGFSGLYMLYQLRRMGFSARIYEAASDVGGTWYWNRYPGARCDTESAQYSYSFSDELQQEWSWSMRYAGQPEILKYLNHVADRFDLRSDIVFDVRIQSAIFDEEKNHWKIQTSQGETIPARFCIMATGCLSSPNFPKIEGLESFAGPVYHTGLWPNEEIVFDGKKVGIIGTGSSAIQIIPLVAEKAEHLYVFQRSPNYTIPAHNGPLDDEHQQKIKSNYADIRKKARLLPAGFLQDYNDKSAFDLTLEGRQREYEKRWAHGGLPFLASFSDLQYNEEANNTAGAFVRGKIREEVEDPKIAELLSPETILGCRRLCVDTGYYETFNRSNVSLVDVSKSPIDKITAEGVAVSGKSYRLDSLILATGFDAMTGTLLRIDIRGREGNTLENKWISGPSTCLGLMMAGFPNLFTITGPGSPSVLTNMITSIEQHVEWISKCLGYLRENDIGQIEPTVKAEDRWVEHNNDLAAKTLRYKCESWYLGSNIPGKPKTFMPYIGGFAFYAEKCAQVASAGYEGFMLTANRSGDKKFKTN